MIKHRWVGWLHEVLARTAGPAAARPGTAAAAVRQRDRRGPARPRPAPPPGCTSAASRPTTPPTSATRRPTWPSTSCSGSGGTPATTCTTCRTSPTSTTRCSSGPRATASDWRELAERETELFRDDMTALRVLPPDDYVGAVEAIPEIVPTDPAAARPGRGVPRRRRRLLLRRRRAAVRLRVAAATVAAMLALFGRARRRPGPAGQEATRSTRCCGGRRGRGSRPGTRRSGPGRPGWHVECAAIALGPARDRRSTCRAAAAT